MSSSTIAIRPRRGVPPAGSAAARDRWVRRRIGIVWGLLFLNVLTFAGGTWSGQPLIVPIPTVLGKIVTQAALPVAMLLALSVNRRVILRPNVFLSVLTLLVIEALVSSVHPVGHLSGTLYRTARLGGFVATLWLLSPWWGRRDLLLVRSHVKVLTVVIISVILGFLVSPGRALAGGRLSGAFWPTPPTQVADFAAVLIGLMVVLWLCGLERGRRTLLVLVVVGVMLVLTHSRTELVAMVAGILVAGLSIFTARARVRRVLVAFGVVTSLGVTVFSGVLTAWLDRGENAKELASLTGRTSVWNLVLSAPRDPFQIVFGYGLSNKSFNGLPIDSNWLASYYDLGAAGVVICAALLLWVLVAAYFQLGGAQRALALFLVTYLVVTSFTETGFSDASVALLELALAASLLVVPYHRDRPPP
ncbi:MAG TPA: O-antigen ligase family protein [Streptosporangiaceae bacterium]|jgi:hypothetical protein